MQAPEHSKTLNNLGQAFSSALSRTLSEACDQQWKVAVSNQPAFQAPDASDAMCFRLTLTGALDGETYLVLRRDDVSKFRLKAANDANVSPQEPAQVLTSALQGISEMLTPLLAEYGAVTAQLEAVSDPVLPTEHLIELLGKAEDPRAAASLFLFISPRLVSAAHAHSAKGLAYPPAAPSANLDLVLDVELNVTLRFGQRQLALREVLDLTSGSVVELDRQVDEPVELVLDGRVVARGEAVIIDGNYGMRITQVLQPIVA